MSFTLHCIALRKVHSNERSSILTAWSREMGCVSLSMPESDSKESRRRRALTMPLFLFEGVCNGKENKEIKFIKDIRPLKVAVSMSLNPVKASVALFLAEIIVKVLRDTQADEHISDFLFSSSSMLDELKNTNSIANFHIYFLVNLTKYLGIFPDISSYKNGYIFDLQEGRFVSTAPLHKYQLGVDESGYLRKLLRINARNLHLYNLNRNLRVDILNKILLYYSLHHTKVNVILP